MPSILIRNLPEHIHARLKSEAAVHRRSVNQETIAVLEAGLSLPFSGLSKSQIPEPVEIKGQPLSTSEILAMIDDGLDSGSSDATAGEKR